MWSPEHGDIALIGVALASEIIGVSKLKSNSVVQLLLSTVKFFISGMTKKKK